MFFSVHLSKDEMRLSYRMKASIRFSFIFILISLTAMFIFSFSPGDFANAPLLGKINIFLLPFLALLGSVYQYAVILDKSEGTITVIRGIYPFRRRETFIFEDLKAVVYSRVGGVDRSSDLHRRVILPRYSFGFHIGKKYFLLERGGGEKKIAAFLVAFKAFFPGEVPVIA